MTYHKKINDSEIIKLHKEFGNCCKVAKHLGCSYTLVRYRLIKNGISTSEFKQGKKPNFIPWNKGTNGLMPTPWNKGIKMSEEIIEKNRQSHLGKKHSEETKKLISTTHTKERNANWKGGCRRIYHEEARRILEKYYGFSWNKMYYPEDPLIHHINGDYKDQRFENLCVMSRSDHIKLHWEQGDIR